MKTYIIVSKVIKLKGKENYGVYKLAIKASTPAIASKKFEELTGMQAFIMEKLPKIKSNK